MYPSVEARWFMVGKAPEEALRWIQQWEFSQSRLTARPEPREDRYIRLPDTCALGVKLREGRFEVKRRDIELGEVVLAARARGRLSSWRKWSFKVVDDIGGQSNGEDWITVRKQRHQRKYRMKKGRIEPSDPEDLPNLGCTVELTRLEVRGAHWWSVGLEAFGPEEDQLRGTLELAAERCFAGNEYPSLEAARSLDYPEWLVSLD